MIPVGPVAEVGDPPLHPLASSRARFASDSSSPSNANGRNAEPPTSPTTATSATCWPLIVETLASPTHKSLRLVALLCDRSPTRIRRLRDQVQPESRD